jgi:hypothetical protein
VPDKQHTIGELEPAFKRAAAALRDSGVPYAVGGSVAFWARGGPEAIKDLDFIVKPEDADRALEALSEAGFEPEKPPEEWLYKAWDGDAMVDLIFSPEGLEITDEILERGGTTSILSMTVPIMALEDAVTTKLLAYRETYLDYSALLQITRALREQVDWDEVRSRTEHSPFARAFFYLVAELGIVEPAGPGRALTGSGS